MKKAYAVSPLFAEEMKTLMEKQEAFLLENKAASHYDGDVEQDNRPYQVVKGIAMFDIRGKMLTSADMFTRWMGVATYDVIANTLVAMSQDEEVNDILISMDTPGGAVSGISDISDTWSRVNAVKPITVHSPGMIASAGMWLSANSSKIYASETADIGSIGVIMQHASYQKMLEKDGIKVTAIKSSPLKAVGSPAKDLTEEELAYLQKHIDDANDLFQKQMYTKRPSVLPEAMTGATFSASEALRLGLIDGISTFSEVFEELSASADSNNNHSYQEDFSMKKKVTEAMAEAAIGLGADASTFDIVSQEDYDAHILENPEAKDDVPDVDATDDVPDVEAMTEELETVNAQVVTLTDEIGTVNAQVGTLTSQVEDLEGQLKAADADPLRKIAEDRISVMRVALGMVKVDMSAFAVTSLLAEYTALDAQFSKNFKSGGHVDVKADPKKPADANQAPVVPTAAVGFE